MGRAILRQKLAIVDLMLRHAQDNVRTEQEEQQWLKGLTVYERGLWAARLPQGETKSAISQQQQPLQW